MTEGILHYPALEKSQLEWVDSQRGCLEGVAKEAIALLMPNAEKNK